MIKLYSTLFATFLVATCAIAQGPNHTDPEKRAKTVRGCEYEVLPGLAEITSVQIVRDAAVSALKYDEHEVLFRFTPMEGGEMLEFLKDEDIEFVLRSRAIRIPVGPQYIEQKNLKVGTKYAMDLLQTRNKEACLERYTFESKALDNDLFEAEENIISFMKEDYANQAAKREAEYLENKATKKAVVEPAVEHPNLQASAVTESSILEEIKNDPTIDWTKITDKELRILVETKMEEARKAKTLQLEDTEGIDIDKIKAEADKKIREKYKDQLEDAAQTTTPLKTEKRPSQASVLKAARKEAKEKERLAQLEAQKKERLEKERLDKIEKLKIQFALEAEQKIKDEIAAKNAAALKQQQLEAEKEAAQVAQRQEALAKIQAIELEYKQRIIDEEKRKQCAFGERISGTIEVVKVSKAKEASESPFKYVEYEVLVSFRPDNYADLSKKEKKDWEKLYTFTIDPKCANANPGAGYIRKYKVFKASKYQGFAQLLENGICNELLLFSPDLPIDSKQIKLN